MEVIVRIAEEKFLKPGIEKNMGDSTKKILDDHVIPEFNKYST